MAEKITHWRFNSYLKAWILKNGDDGCELCTDESIQLSLSKPPPPLRDQPVAARKESALLAWSRKQRSNDPYDNVFEGIAEAAKTLQRFARWLDKPRTPVARKISPTVLGKPPQKNKTPHFDIAEIPEVIRKLGMPKAAGMMDKWFQGELNYSPTDKDSKKELNQYGKQYPQSMIDKDSITMDWVLNFPRAKKEFDELKSGRIFKTSKSIDAIKKIALKFHQGNQIIAWEESGRDIQKMHHEFQFQYIKVEGSISQKFQQYGKQLWSAGGIPDELTLILGSFNIYAAIAYADFTKTSGRRFINITHVYFYIRDGFTFTDDRETASQYLGHWSKKGVAIVILKQATVTAGIEWVDVPTLHKTNLGLSVMYPIKNSDFRKWQLLHKQGGDYIIYTDKIITKLDHPLLIEF